MFPLSGRLPLRSLMIAFLLLGFGIVPAALASPAGARPGPSFVEYALPAGASGPEGIVQGPDGAMWFAQEYSDQIGRITSSGQVTEYQLFPGAAPIDVAVGRDGAIWFSEYGAYGKVGKITTSGAITQYSLPSAGARTWGITAGPDGNLWFTEYDQQKIGRITTNGVV